MLRLPSRLVPWFLVEEGGGLVRQHVFRVEPIVLLIFHVVDSRCCFAIGQSNFRALPKQSMMRLVMDRLLSITVHYIGWVGVKFCPISRIKRSVTDHSHWCSLMSLPLQVTGSLQTLRWVSTRHRLHITPLRRPTRWSEASSHRCQV